MITSLIFYILFFILGLVADLSNLIFRGWSIWPSQFLTGLTYFLTCLMKFDMWLNIVGFYVVLKWFMGFLALYYSGKILLQLINWIRGSGKIDV